MNVEDDYLDDGQVPFADRRFDRSEMTEISPSTELATILEREIKANSVDLPTEDFLEVRCTSMSFATAAFMLKRGPDGELRMLAPASVVRKPN